MNDLLATLLAQTDALRSPLPGPSPGGIDLWHEPEFEPLQAEIRKLEGVAGAPVNWPLLSTAAFDLLASRTKDLRLATWAVAASLEGRNWVELARTLVVLRSLVIDHWDVVFPARPKARSNHVDWLYNRAKGQLEALTVTEADGDAVRLCDVLFRDIDEAFTAKAGAGYGGLGPLRGVLRQRVSDIPTPPPAPSSPLPPPLALPPSPPLAPAPPAQAAPAPPAQVAPAPPAQVAPAPTAPRAPEPASSNGQTMPSRGPDISPVLRPELGPRPSAVDVSNGEADVELSPFEGEGADDAEHEKALREQAKAFGVLGRALGKAAPTRALAYRLVRAAAWLPLENLPGREGKLPSSAAPYDVQEAIKRAIDDGNWLEVLQRAEDEILLTPLWLDLQRHVAAALERLGPSYHAARDEVGAASIALACVHPNVLSYSFDDGSPVADDDTRAWFEAEAKRWAKAGGWLFAEDAAIDRRASEAREHAAAGRLEEGLGLAVEIARRGADPRARFIGQLEIARLAMKNNAQDVARPLLESLVKTVEGHNLDAWEPTLAAAVYEELVRCLRTERGRVGVDDSTMREATFFERLCRLDPAAALRAIKDA